MAQKILTFAELHQYCNDFLTNINNFDTFLHDFSLNLYNTGLRFNELFQLDRWDPYGEESVECDTEKDSYNRIFNYSELTVPFITSVYSNESVYLTCRYTTYIRYFHRYFPFYPLYCGNKGISSHIFRHHKAKEMHEDGYTDEEIQLYLGEKELQNARGYIYSNIYIIIPD